MINIDNPTIQLRIYEEIIAKELTVRQVEDRVRELTEPKPKEESKKPVSTFDIHLRDVQYQLGNKYNTKIQIKADESGKGEIRLNFYSQEDLNRLLELLS